MEGKLGKGSEEHCRSEEWLLPEDAPFSYKDVKGTPMQYENIREEKDENGNAVVKAFCPAVEEEVTFHPRPGNTMDFNSSEAEEVDENGHVAMFSRGGMSMPRRGESDEACGKMIDFAHEISKHIQEMDRKDRFIHVNEDGTIEHYADGGGDPGADKRSYVTFYHEDEKGDLNPVHLCGLRIQDMELEFPEFNLEEIQVLAREMGRRGYVKLIRNLKGPERNEFGNIKYYLCKTG